MPHLGSFSATAAKVSLAFSYQKECSIATALLNCCCTVGSQEIVNFTLPSLLGSPAGWSCWATAGATKTEQTKATKSVKIKVSRFMLASFAIDIKGERYLLEAFEVAAGAAPSLNSAAVRFTWPTDCAMITLPFGTLSSCDHTWKLIPSVVATRSATSLALSGVISRTWTRPVAISCLWSCQFLFQSAKETAPVRVMDLATMYSTCSRRAPGSLDW